MSELDVYTEMTARDYVYVDEPRVRSRLSQLMGGLPTEESGQRSSAWQLGLNKVLAAQRSGTQQSTETRSLADLHAAMLEDQARAAGMLPNVTDLAKKPSRWFKKAFRNIFEPGSLFLVDAPTQLLAPDEIVALFTRMAAFGAPDGMIEQMEGIVGSLYGGSLAIRVFPCDPTDSMRTFAGLFADQGDYIGKERSLLIPRFGSSSPTLTVLAQVTRVSTQQEEPRAMNQDAMARLQASMMSDQSTINRSGLEGFLKEMVRMLESNGLLESPTWPAVGILPLAIYRTVGVTDPQFLGVDVPD